jgi:hypothetical protein
LGADDHRAGHSDLIDRIDLIGLNELIGFIELIDATKGVTLGRS